MEQLLADLEICDPLAACKSRRDGAPQMVIADTVKGKGVAALETDTLCHVKSLLGKELEAALEGLQ